MRKTTATTTTAIALAAALGLLTTATTATATSDLAFDSSRPRGYLRSSSSASFLRGMMYDQGEPSAPQPIDAPGAEHRMYDQGEPIAPPPGDDGAGGAQGQKREGTPEPLPPISVQDKEEPLYHPGAPVAPPPVSVPEQEKMYDQGEPAAPQPVEGSPPRAAAWPRHNSSPSETFEYRLNDNNKKEGAATGAAFYPAPVDQEEGDVPFEGRDRVLAGVPVCAPSFVWTSENGELRVNGQPFHLKGINWFGFETERRIPGGLDLNSMDFYLQFLKDQKFNAIRIPISVDMALDPNGTPEAEVVDAPLIAQNNFQRLSTLVDRAGEFGILVMLDMHRLSPDVDITPLWYDDQHTYDTYLQAWDNVLNIFGGKWNVFAIDLKNEPHGVATWGTNTPATDWNSAAEAIGKHLAAAHPSYTGLFFVEGIDNPTNVGSKNHVDTHSKPWGGDLEGVKAKPINMGAALNNRVVYSPHVYGPSVFDREYFQASDFPANMPEIWHNQWSFVEKQTGRAVVIGEWGGKYEADGPVQDRDRIWQDTLGKYLVQNCLEDSFYWTLNPNSGDTGGLLMDDWTTPNLDKLALLASVQIDPSLVARTSETEVCVVSGSYTNPLCATV